MIQKPARHLNLNVNTCWSDEHVAPLLAVQPFDSGPDSIITIGARRLRRDARCKRDVRSDEARTDKVATRRLVMKQFFVGLIALFTSSVLSSPSAMAQQPLV